MNISDIWPEWQVEKILGRGSYGAVYKCFKNNTDASKEYSAIKVISVPQDDYEINSIDSNGMTNEQTKDYYKDIVDEFLGEIKILESLKNNKNIVNIFDSKVIEKDEGIGWQIFIRMELLTDFNTYSSNKEMHAEDILKLGTDLCEALKVCSKQKIIHRDIKPENIFVDNDGNFKLGDFGVAKQLEKTEMSLSRKGTYNYMAPEVFNSKKYDSRADIYSLGLVMYKLFNRNRLPFLDPNKQMIKYSDREEAFEKRIRGEKITPINDLDENTNNLLLRACAYKVDERFRTVEEFENAIKSISEGKKVKKSLKQFISSPKGIAVIAVVLVLSIVSGILVYSLTKTDSDNNTPDQETSVSPEEEKKIKINYSGMCNGVYTYDGIDYCAGYNEKFYAISSSEETLLSDQQVTTEFTIINDKIYYSVIDSVKDEYDFIYNGWDWAQCSCWRMDPDGSNREKILDYEGSGNVIWSDDKNIYYTEDPEANNYSSTYYRSVKKYDLSTKTSSTIVSATACSTDDTTEETGCANAFYYDGFILCGGASDDICDEGGKIYRYNINEDKLETLDIKTNNKIVDFENGLFYIITTDISEETGESSYNLVEYDVVNNKLETIAKDVDYIVEGKYDNKLLLSAYSDRTEYYTYGNGKFEQLKDLGKVLEQCEEEPEFRWTASGIVVWEHFNGYDCAAEKISLINGTDKKVLAVEQGKKAFTFLGCGENIAVFADDYHDNAACSVYSINYSQSSAGKQVNVAVPYVRGEQYEEYKDYLKFLGFKVNVKEEYSDDNDSTANAGEILDIAEAENKLAYGSEIHITVSKGFKDRKIVIKNMPVMDGMHHITVSFGKHVIDEKIDAELNGGNYTVKLHPEYTENEMCFSIGDNSVPADNDLEIKIDDELYYSGYYSFSDAELINENYYPLTSPDSPSVDESETTAPEEIPPEEA